DVEDYLILDRNSKKARYEYWDGELVMLSRSGEKPMVDIDVEDYLILDRNSKNARYEYLDGRLVMLAGGSNYHSVIIARLTRVVEGHLEDGPCWTFSSDVRLQLSEDRYVHPDLTVSCDPRDQSEQDEIHYPKLV